MSQQSFIPCQVDYDEAIESFSPRAGAERRNQESEMKEKKKGKVHGGASFLSLLFLYSLLLPAVFNIKLDSPGSTLLLCSAWLKE